MPSKPDKFTRSANKIADDIAAYAQRHDARTYVLDPAKFGRVCSGAPDTKKYAVCRRLNAVIAAKGTITEAEVRAAFIEAGLA